MMNEIMLELVRKGFSIHIYPVLDNRCTVTITHLIQDKSAIGYGYCPEKALAVAMMHYIDGHGRIE